VKLGRATKFQVGAPATAASKPWRLALWAPLALISLLLLGCAGGGQTGGESPIIGEPTGCNPAPTLEPIAPDTVASNGASANTLLASLTMLPSATLTSPMGNSSQLGFSFHYQGPTQYSPHCGLLEVATAVDVTSSDGKWSLHAVPVSLVAASAKSAEFELKGAATTLGIDVTRFGLDPAVHASDSFTLSFSWTNGVARGHIALISSDPNQTDTVTIVGSF